jgi:hypothetical protein
MILKAITVFVAFVAMCIGAVLQGIPARLGVFRWLGSVYEPLCECQSPLSLAFVCRVSSYHLTSLNYFMYIWST